MLPQTLSCPDVNVLVNALRPAGHLTDLARDYLLDAGTANKVLLPDVVASACRIMTNPRVFENPLSLGQVRTAVEELLELPGVGLAQVSERRLGLMWRLSHEYEMTGDELADAYLVAGAWDLGARFVTFDRRLGRLPTDLVTVIALP